ncbi:MAG: ribonuclease HII [Desulfurococcales archaeon]|nr:ribonuclease HII [Desulfurococcales archaeon]
MAAERCYIIGVDEAGRGSIVGEMMVAAIAVPHDESKLLVELGVKDSKLLTPNSRSRLYRELSSRYPFAVVPVRPWEIDEENLNALTAKAASLAVSVVAERVGGFQRVCGVYVDRFGDPGKLRVMLRLRGYKGSLIVEEKADLRYPVVGAASIIAKHVRDRRIRVLRSIYGVEGSGYPSDPRTMEWVRRVLSSGVTPPIIRYSWESLRDTPYYKPKRKKPAKVTLEDFF